MKLTFKTKVTLLIAICVSPVLFLLYIAFSPFDPPPPFSLERTLSRHITISPVEATSEICGNEYDCVEAWDTQIGTFMKFFTKREAEYVAYVLGSDARSNGSYVVDFSGKDLSFQQKAHAIHIIYPGKDWY